MPDPGPRRRIYESYRPGDSLRLARNVLFPMNRDERFYPSFRQGTDNIQPVFGYFSGGGWAFGMAERDGARIHPSSYENYRNPLLQSFDVIFYDERTGAVSRTVRVQTSDPQAPNYIQPFSTLRPIDQAAVFHDQAYQMAREARAQGGSLYAMMTAQSDADAAFLAVVSSTQPGYAANPALLEYELAYRIPISLALGGYAAFRDSILALFDSAVAAGTALQGGFEDWYNDLRDSRDSMGGSALPFAMAGGLPSLEQLEAWEETIRRGEQATFEAGLGSTIGSSLGNYLAQGNVIGGIVYSSVLGEIGERLALSLSGAGGANIDASGEVTVAVGGSFASDVWTRMQGAAVGAISSMLAAELGQALGLEGFGAEIFNTGASTVIGRVITNLTTPGATAADMFNGFGQAEFFTDGGVGSLALNAIGSFIGARLGAMVVNPQTQAAVALSSIGSAVGAYVAVAQIGVGIFGGGGFATAMGNLIVPGLGAFVGFVLGALIGNLFGRKKPKIPTASATSYLDVNSDRFEVGYSSSADGGNLDLVKSMATSARDTLNGFLSVMVGDFAFDAVVGYQRIYQDFQFHTVPNTATTVFGHTGSQLWVKFQSQYSQKINISSADEGVSKAVLHSLTAANVVGGDILIKRAIQASADQGTTDLSVLLGNLQVAADYRYYLNNRQMINGHITGAYYSLSQSDKDYYDAQKSLIDKIFIGGIADLTSAEVSYYTANKAIIDRIVLALDDQAIANPWIVTLQRVAELGLDKFRGSDFYGGLQGFLMHFGLETYGAYFEDLSFTTTGYDLNLVLPTTVEEGVFSLLPQASADGRTLTIPEFIDPYGSVGPLSPTNDVGYLTPSFNANSDRNDYINLSSSTAAVTITDYRVEWEERWEWVNPETGMYEALPEPIYVEVTYTGGNDIFVGGSGNDILNGYAGWDWLAGGEGADTINGGYDNDVLIGGGGSDMLIGDHGADYLAGGAGNDNLSGGAQSDVLIGGAGADYLNGGDGDDILLVDQGDNAQDIIDGAGGLDALSFERWTQGVTHTLNSVMAATTGYYEAFGDIHSGIEDLIGSRHNDVFTGDGLANRLYGGAGNDKLYGMNGADTLEGGTGSDVLNGGGGTDTASYAGSRGGVYVDLTEGEAFGGDATDDGFVSIENLRGSRYADELKGDAGANRLEGGEGDDWLVATAGSDVFDGGDGVDTVDYSGATAGVAVNLGSRTETTTVNGAGSSGLAAGHTLIGIEGVLGSDFADTLSAGAGSHEFMGGKGADSLSGGAGSDTYYFDAGDGFDTITETNTEENVVVFGAEIGFNSLSFSYAGGGGGFLDIYYGSGDTVRIAGNHAVSTNNRLKVLDMNGAGMLDLSQIHHVIGGGSSAANTINGLANYYDLIAGYAGNDVLRGSGGSWEDKGNVIIGGAGDDAIITSVGDDQFAFERGSGRDTITDAGGEDTIAFGPNVAADDVIYKVVGNDLYIGIAEDANPTYEANQVTDYVRVVNGAIRYENVSTGAQSYASVEFINAGGSWIDLRKLDIDWVTSYTSGWPPIVFDLQGDGLDLIGVDQSKIVSQLESGYLARTSWVGPTDGFLAVDRDGDGQINRSSEISFLGDKEGAKTDLEGLQAWDTNGDGKISALDDGWSRLKLWVDLNQNGRSTTRELKTLDEAGIVEINLTGTPTGATFETSGGDTFAHNTLSFTWASGEKGAAYDVELGRNLIGAEGLSLDELRAAWGDGLSDAELGRLISKHPGMVRMGGKAPPFGADPRDPKYHDLRREYGLEDGDVELGIDFGAVRERADFSDHDELFAEDLARQLERLRTAPQSTEVDPAVRAALGLLSDGIARPGMFGRPFRVAEEGPPSAPASQASSAAAQISKSAAQARAGALDPASGPADRRLSRMATLDLDEAAARLAYTEGGSDDPWAAAPVTLAGGPARSRWWAESVPETRASAGGASSTATIGTGQVSADRVDLATADPAVLSAHQKLTQAMAAFGPRSGGGAAVWRRSGELAETADMAADTRSTRWRFQPSARMSA